jgi:glycosyltransferase involved in cell wall biosynthesis
LQQTIKDFEIIVVDSGSTDNTLSIACQYPVRIVSIGPEEFSFGSSLNRGCDSARGDYVVIASAHVYPLYVDWLEQLLAPFQDHKVSLVYGKQIGGETTKFSECQIFEKWFPDNSNFSQDHPFCNNANAAIRRDIWQQHQYDEKLTGLEDLAWAHVTMQAGYKIAYQSKAIVVHVHDEKPMQIFNRYRREAIALKKVFPNEKFNLWNFVRLFISNVFNDYCRAISLKKLRTNWLGIFDFRLMQFWGTFRGFAEYGRVSEKLKHKFYYPNNMPKNKVLPTSQNKEDSLLVDYQSRDCHYHDNN